MLLSAILCGGVWNGFLLGKAKKEDVPCRFRGRRDGDGHLFWDCTFKMRGETSVLVKRSMQWWPPQQQGKQE